MQHHEVAPPAFLLQTIKSKIADGEIDDLKKAFSPLYNHSSLPPAVSFEQIMQKINSTEPINVFKRLSNFEKPAPISFATIMERLRALGYFNSKPSAKVVSFDLVKKIMAAAAVVLLLIGGYFMFNKISDNNTAEGVGLAGTNGSTVPTSSNNNAAIDLPINDTTQNSAANNAQPAFALKNRLGEQRNFTANNIKKSNNKRRNKNSVIDEAMPEPKPEILTIGGESFTILENDYLATFASFTPNKLPLFLQAENPVETQITVDKYSYFNITDGMGAMMKKMYATKKDSITPTRTARKQKAKLEKWKISDSIYFKQNSTINPLDPRDLGNLILNK